jgi:para-aminobenzoate synthetase component 1
MNRISHAFTMPNPAQTVEKLFAWAQSFNHALWFNSNSYPYREFDNILAVDALTTLETNAGNVFTELEAYRKKVADWIFGYFTYDVKNALENLCSHNIDGLHFPDVYFIQPRKLFFIKENQLTISYTPDAAGEIERDVQDILSISAFKDKPHVENRPIKVKARFSKREYLECVEKIKAHILRGDFYEANFCQEFYAPETTLTIWETYKKLNALSHAPFSACLKFRHYQAACASPERYLQKRGNRVISQPIKGSARRSPDAVEDNRLRETLQNSSKERAENIMIVDLVRNDLSKIAQKGSVEVAELCGGYSFKTIHQLISTITCTVAENTDPIEIIKATFPMGSMTGAPKIAAMHHLETMEKTKRGLYSGAIGYFSPTNDFDFNVVIRSILYNAARKYVSYSVGSAITAKSVPAKEYHECMVKARAMKQALEE